MFDRRMSRSTGGRTMYVYSDGTTGGRVEQDPGMVQTNAGSIFPAPAVRFTHSSSPRTRRPRPLSFTIFKSANQARRPPTLLPVHESNPGSRQSGFYGRSPSAITPSLPSSRRAHSHSLDIGPLLIRRIEARHQQTWKRQHESRKYPSSRRSSRINSLRWKSIQCLILGLAFAVSLTTCKSLLHQQCHWTRP